MTHTTREAWLEEAVERLRPLLPELPKRVRVSVGFPGGGAARKRIGEHWHPKASKDGISQIFISPILDEPLETLVHELVHACVPDDGHGKLFKRIALRVGLEGPMRATKASQGLMAHLKALMATPYPHASISLSDRKKQSTRLLKASCAACGYTCRVTSKWLSEVGAPICPCNFESMLIF